MDCLNSRPRSMTDDRFPVILHRSSIIDTTKSDKKFADMALFRFFCAVATLNSLLTW